MTTSKRKKGKYTKRNHEFWAMRSRKMAEKDTLKPKSEPDNKAMLGLILDGVDRLSIGDKARVFAHILGKDQLDENQLWAIQKILT